MQFTGNQILHGSDRQASAQPVLKAKPQIEALWLLRIQTDFSHNP